MVTAVLMMNLLAAAPASAPKPCEALPAPMRVRMTVATSRWRSAEPTIRRLVEETWTPAGLQVEWADAGFKDDAVDFRIAIVLGMPTTAEDGALGFVKFNGDEPAPMAWVFIDAALAWARRYQARRHSVSVNALSGAEDPEIVGRVLGYSAAHELGHFVLKTKAHASSGVMRATYRRTRQLFESPAWRLDDRNRQRLQQRMSDRCGRRAIS